MRRKLCNFLFLTLLCVFSGCTTGKTKKISEGAKQESEVSIYNDAVVAFRQNKLKTSRELFQKVADIAPFSSIGEKAKRFYTEILYKEDKFAAAAGSAGEYILNYPEGEQLDYILSIQGNAYLRMLKSHTSSTEFIMKAQEAFKVLINRFPASQYVPDARQKLLEIKEIMAEKVFLIGLFYFKEMSYHAAIGRFDELIRDYRATKYYSEALLKRAEAYKALGVNVSSS